MITKSLIIHNRGGAKLPSRTGNMMALVRKNVDVALVLHTGLAAPFLSPRSSLIKLVPDCLDALLCL